MLITNGSRRISSYLPQIAKIVVIALAIILFVAPIGGNLASAECGDTNGDGSINLNDVLFLVAYIFLSGEPPQIPEDADVNCDGSVNISDAVFMIDAIFKGGPLPCEGCR